MSTYSRSNTAPGGIESGAGALSVHAPPAKRQMVEHDEFAEQKEQNRYFRSMWGRKPCRPYDPTVDSIGMYHLGPLILGERVVVVH